MNWRSQRIRPLASITRNFEADPGNRAIRGRVRRSLVERYERLPAVGCEDDVVAIQPQFPLNGLSDGRLVAYHEDGHLPSSVRREPKRMLRSLTSARWQVLGAIASQSVPSPCRGSRGRMHLTRRPCARPVGSPAPADASVAG